MGRAAVLGNGRLAVGINESGFVHDFYFPYVGLDNLTTARSSHHKIGIMVDGKFSWLSDKGWVQTTRLRDDFLGSNTQFKNEKLSVTIETTDFVDFEFDAFCRIFKIYNGSEKEREIRLFTHQVFQISNDGRADTALYVPNQEYILDYKGRTSLLINGLIPETGESFDQYAIGNYGIDGKQGTFKDAEDGVLSNNPVEHGAVDTVLRFSLKIAAGGHNLVEYWVAASDSQYKCEKINTKLKEGIYNRLNANYLYWTNWLKQSEKKLQNLNERQKSIVIKSLFTIKAHTDARGGIIASLDSSIYNYGKDYYTYVWPRDGALTIWPLMRLGYQDEAKNFFRFIESVINPEGYIMHKYQPDSSIGSTWHPLAHPWGEELAIQEDETATVIFMLGEYMRYFDDTKFIESLFDSLITPAANFLATFMDDETGLPHASYDLWEEKFLTTTYSVATVYAGLLSAIEISEKLNKNANTELWHKAVNTITSNFDGLVNAENGALLKGFLNTPPHNELKLDKTVDVSSLYGCMIFNYYPQNSEYLSKTVELIESNLKTNQGLVGRYENDGYFRSQNSQYSNPWVITTFWLAQYYLRRNKIEKAEELIRNVEETIYSDSVFPEQVSPNSSKEPISVTPLVWSHAEYINTILDLYAKK